MLPMAGGEPWSLDALTAELDKATRQEIEGITLLGGEPFTQAPAAARFAALAQRRELSVMVFSGFTLPQLHSRRDSDVTRLLEQTDLLVDGPFLNQQPDRDRAGSDQQTSRSIS